MTLCFSLFDNSKKSPVNWQVRNLLGLLFVKLLESYYVTERLAFTIEAHHKRYHRKNQVTGHTNSKLTLNLNYRIILEKSIYQTLTLNNSEKNYSFYNFLQ